MSGRPVLFVTTNDGKVREAIEILGPGYLVAAFRPREPVEETAETYDANARLKLEAARRAVPDVIAIADDSGLEVDALGALPGPRSSRWAGPGADDAARRRKLLAELEGLPEERRDARFVCAIAVAIPGRAVRIARGVCEGRIAFEERGESGFGYDPVFVPEGRDRSFGELPPETKNAISHRAAALRVAKAWLDASG